MVGRRRVVRLLSLMLLRASAYILALALEERLVDVDVQVRAMDIAADLTKFWVLLLSPILHL